jgi:hypothetical protein
MFSDLINNLPDIRDGLSHRERVILYCLVQLQKERDGRNVPTAMLYGRVIEHEDMSIAELQAILVKLGNNSNPDNA